MPNEGITIKLRRTEEEFSDLSGYEIVYGEPLYFDNSSGHFLAVGDSDNDTVPNAYIVKLVPRKVGSGSSAIDIASNPVFYKILDPNDSTAVALIKDTGVEIYPKTILSQVVDNSSGTPVSIAELLDKKVDVDIVGGSSLTGRIGMGVDSGGIYVVYDDGLTIVTQPVNQTVTAGNTVAFSVTAVGAGTISYQWQYSTDSGETWSDTALSGNKTETLSFSATAARSGYQYRCKVTDGVDTVYSNAAILTVT